MKLIIPSKLLFCHAELVEARYVYTLNLSRLTSQVSHLTSHVSLPKPIRAISARNHPLPTQNRADSARPPSKTCRFRTTFLKFVRILPRNWPICSLTFVMCLNLNLIIKLSRGVFPLDEKPRS